MKEQKQKANKTFKEVMLMVVPAKYAWLSLGVLSTIILVVTILLISKA